MADNDILSVFYGGKYLDITISRGQSTHQFSEKKFPFSCPVYLLDLSEPDGIKINWDYIKKKLGLEN